MWLLLSNDLNSIIINFNEHYFISFISSLFQVHYKDGCHYKGTEKVALKMTTTGVLIFPFSDLFLFPIPMQRRPRDEKYLTSHFPLLHTYAIVECLRDHKYIIYHP